MTRETNAYILNTEVANRLDSGYKLVVKNKPSDIDDPYQSRVLETISKNKYNSIYIVGCGLGDILVNLKKLRRDTIVAGCEVSEVFRNYGRNYFNFSGVEFDIKEPPYHELPNADLMVSLNYLGDNPVSLDVFNQMLTKSNKVILFDRPSVRSYMGENSTPQCVSVDEEEYSVYTKIEEVKPAKPAYIDDIWASSRLQASGAPSQGQYETYEQFHTRVYGDRPGLSG